MYKVLIIINAHQVSNQGTVLSTSPATQRMIASFKDAIIATESQGEEALINVLPSHELLNQKTLERFTDSSWLYCPLTIELPPLFEFPAVNVFRHCREVKKLRQSVEEKFQISTGNHIKKVWHGNYWLPIVLTAKGPMYGEVIGEGALPNSYQQPIEFSDKKRQLLYHLGGEILELITAQPGVYLLQFGFQNKTLIFDRVWPFPAAPALASVGIQKPNLYSCHWQCLTEKPIRDVVICH